jgi:hypothetical protein
MENYRQLARDFWEQATIGQSVLIKGQAAGEDVLSELAKCDLAENLVDDGKGLRRRRERPKNCIGGYNAQKQFRYQVDLRPDEGGGGKAIKHYTIWRVQ